MRLNKFSSQLLKYMVKCFHDDGKDCFNYDDFVKKFPNAKDHELKAALYNIEHDDLISIKSYSNRPELTFLKVNAIIQIEEDTLVKKGYDLVKEIKSFF